ncbi:type II secretion system protein [Shewanella mangrovisoli]|uniref:type II secretion system protein n=1 Tax=Shewanella mangrovisoli TaxID=2864211 RepID=UPI001C65A9E8|nr:prepilin-type N-terminal cleavage/methylation domain-containing protein [Shewanella mangrovisoli]QYK08558.1 prepilin-type N-terminal cleavage/methylation domain-containing protein [Shewanella mangrovisoli]
MQKQTGFTLIELVVVIIILGILAVTAAPKFINLQSDARESTLQGMKGALQGANSLLYSKAAIAGLEKAKAQIVTLEPGVIVIADYGYLAGNSSVGIIAADLQDILDVSLQELSDDTTTVSSEDWGIRTINGTSFKLVTKGKTADSTVSNACYLVYEAATATTLPQYTAVDSGC